MRMATKTKEEKNLSLLEKNWEKTQKIKHAAGCALICNYLCCHQRVNHNKCHLQLAPRRRREDHKK